MSCVEITPGDFPVVNSFDALHLHEGLMRGVVSCGFEKPCEIQKFGIRPISDGRDTILQAKSGAGKTATYAIGILQQINAEDHVCQAVVLVPTREMALSIEKVVLALGEVLEIRCNACAWLASDGAGETINRFRAGQHCVVGTPGKVIDMINRRHLRVDKVRVLVLDAADEMLSRGLKDYIYESFRALPGNVQVCLCSETMGNEIVDLTMDFMHAAVQVWERKDILTLQDVRQFYIEVEKEEWKLDTLCDIFETLPLQQTIVYCNTRRKVDFVVDQMTKRDFKVSTRHGDLSDRERDLLAREFRSGNCSTVISTDIAANGGDDLDAKLVINYDLPPNRANYMPRVGRVGRGGRGRFAINFITGTEELPMSMEEIERYYGTAIEELPMDIQFIADLM